MHALVIKKPRRILISLICPVKRVLPGNSSHYYDYCCMQGFDNYGNFLWNLHSLHYVEHLIKNARSMHKALYREFFLYVCNII